MLVLAINGLWYHLDHWKMELALGGETVTCTLGSSLCVDEVA